MSPLFASVHRKVLVSEIAKKEEEEEGRRNSSRSETGNRMLRETLERHSNSFNDSPHHRLLPPVCTTQQSSRREKEQQQEKRTYWDTPEETFKQIQPQRPTCTDSARRSIKFKAICQLRYKQINKTQLMSP